ncbi:hypothetical protein [Paraburkholderia sp. BL23I1N1]|uniref:hypothetical protein n=1 Tax=Paraburkholderia sp. BL23I1N1 TaxID=1938802 RepID=UPI0011C3D15C|nr:hypothetical protein [Paraburkholderia sp. BL23I1N1]
MPDEGWCLNESGLNDFLRDLFAAPRALATSADQSASKGVPVALSDEHIEEIRTNISMLESRAWPGDRYIAAHLNLLLTTPAPVAPTDEQSNAPMAAQGPIAREDAIRMVKEYARSLKDERNDQTAMRFWHIVNLLCNGYASQAAPVAPTDERAAIPEEVRHALTHAIGGWRGAACGTRDDEEGEQRSADYRRRAQVIEDWLATCAASTAATVTLTAAQASERDHALIEAIEIVRRCTSSPIDVESRICDRLVVEGARIIGALEAARVFGAAEGTEPVPRASDALAREAIGLLRRVRQVHTGESRQPAAVERDVEDFLALNETARPVAADTGATLRADEIDEFSQTTQDFEDSGETATEYETLMDWAQRGLLECDHFKVTTDGERALAAAIAAAAVKTGEAT